ncbi:MAG: peptide ABC transporter substrate-binding protein [Armatimonadota bacterium]|nr:peptide ABC transporter substrate-binding protein [Armatimonadota bacterium]MDR5696831.1 peptide ABC transporter substrate-binding protein [Armatimonadota bacterium]
MKKRKTSVLLAAAVVLASATLPADAQARRDTVTIAMAQEPDMLGPFSIMAAAGVVHNALFAFVAPFNERWQRVPMMAEKLPTLRDGDWQLLPNQKMRVTWRLRRGFTWHDGRPVTALDWRFTYGMLRNPRTPAISKFILNKVDNVSVPDPQNPYTMVVQWNELWPFAGAEPFGGPYPLPRHILERDYLRDPSRLKAHPYFRAPVGHGPYRFVEWVPGSHIALEAYDRFPLGAPAIRRLTFRFILDATVLQANVIAGNVDGAEIANLNCEQMRQIEQRNPQMDTHYRESVTVEWINFNLDNEWLRDKRVRQAIAHALDRPALASVSCPGGRQPVAHTWVAPGHPGHNANVKKYNHDPARARALLAEAGFVPGPDGILRDRAGRRVEMTIMTTAGNTTREQIQLAMRDQLKQVGIELRIDNRPASVFFGTVVPQRQFPHLAMYASLFTPESIPVNRFHSSQIPTRENGWVGDNRVGWRNAENDRLWEQLASELDERRRVALFRRQQEIFAEELPYLPLYFRLDLTASHRRLRNVRPTGLATYYLPWNVWEWRWDL